MRNTYWFLIGILLIAMFALAAGCDSLPPINSRYTPEQSWDQANLKRNDHGCPTSIYYVNQKTKLLEICPAN